MKIGGLLSLFIILLPSIVLAQNETIPCQGQLPLVGIPCHEEWNCTQWTGQCPSISESRTRRCNDLFNCGTEYTEKPLEEESCAFNLTCIDKDGDSFGKNCFDIVNDSVAPKENDCNDKNPAINPNAADICDSIDNDCDGQADVGCNCVNGDIQNCGSTIGVCSYGVQVCMNGEWSVCGGPGYRPRNPTDACKTGKDEDCDGFPDEDCECSPGETQKCGTTDVGECDFGLQQCQNGKWSLCIGEKPSNPEVAGNCYDSRDNDCDGLIDTQDPNCAKPGDAKNQNYILCTNGQKDAGENGIDCGGICQNPCNQTSQPKEQDSDNDQWSDSFESSQGTDPLKADTDDDAMIDSVDSMPLCPNSACDSAYGETEQNCPEDCKKKSKAMLVFFIILMLLVLAGASFFILKKFKKTKSEWQNKKDIKKQENEKQKKQKQGFETPLSGPSVKKTYETEVEKELSKKIKETEELQK